MKKLFSRLLVSTLLLSVGFTNAYAQLSSLTSGKVYSFVNKLYPTTALTANSATSVGCTATDTSDYSQLWYVTTSGSNYQLRNLANGLYLVGNGTSSAWTLASSSSADATAFSLSTVGDTYNALMCTSYTGGYGYMHCNSSSSIVGWTTSDGSQWTINLVDISDSDLQSNWETLDAIANAQNNLSTYQTALDNIFSDKACTTLNSTFSAMSETEIKSNSYYNQLPEALQNMVLKVKNNAWSEDNYDTTKSGWDAEYAQKYRVQMYSPYSMPNNCANALGIQAHNNHNNPVGVFANTRDVIYVMVEGEIETGAELYISSLIGHSKFGADYKSGASCVALTSGLNVVPYYTDGNSLYIQYVVKTFTDDGEKQYRLSDYDDLKIHVEGGYLCGFFDVAGDELYDYDTDEDWTYLVERANLTDIEVMGRHMVLHFPLNDADTDGNKGLATYWLDYIDDLGNTVDGKSANINKIVEAWDRIVMSHFVTMGLLSKDSIAVLNSKFPRWYTDENGNKQRGEMYTYNGDDGYDEYASDYSDYFNHRPVAFGVNVNYMFASWDYCGYHYNTMESILTQIADEAGPTWGPAHEIGHQHQGPLNLNGLTEVTNNMFANISVWYMGMGTSRVNGSSLESVLNAYNTDGNDFYTNDIWSQTQMYYHLWLYYHLCGNNTKFYPRLFEMLRRDPMQNGTYIDGEESLLKFYKFCCIASGEDLTEFFRAYGFLEVMDNRLVGDYSNGYYTQTQEQIDRVVAEVKALGYEENLAVLLISDDVAGDTYVSHDGVTARSDWDGSTAELGSCNDFIDGTEAGEYTTVANADGTVTMSGSGGLGFIITDENGKLLSFSTNTTFALSDEAAYALATGTATIASVGSDNETATVDASALQADLLQALIDKVQAIADVTDDGTYTKIGFYKQSVVASMNAALETAKEVLASGSGYGAAYELLYSEYEAVKSNDAALVPFSAAHTYKLVNYAYPTRVMTVNSSNNIAALTDVTPESDTSAQWIFESTGTDGVYNVKNAAGLYAGTISSSSALATTTSQSDAGTYTVDNLGNGLWTVSLSPAESYKSFHSAANSSYQVVGWETGAGATKWYLTAITPDELEVDKLKLEDLVARTNELLAKTAEITYETNAITLQVTNSASDYYLSCSNVDPSEGSMANLIDDNASTYMHSNWHSASSSNDYLQVNLGSGNGITAFKFAEVTRSSVANDFPKTVEILGSNDGASWTTITTVDGLPQSGGASWESDVINAGLEYTYLRFVVTTGTNRIYFHMAEFDLYEATPVATINSTLDATIVTPALAVAALNEASASAAVVANSSATATEVEAQYTALETAYNALAEAYENAQNAAITNAETDLETLMAQAAALLEQAGSVYVPTVTGTTALQTTDAAADFYIWTNAQEGGEGPIANLVDGSTGNFFHTQWSNSGASDDGLDHYIEVDLGEGNSLQNFHFTYTTRSGAANDYPQVMEIYGSNTKNTTGDTSAYTLITTISSGMPTSGGTAYTSDVITAAASYRYLRFMVTTTTTDRSGAQHNYWHMAEFDLISDDETTVEIEGQYTGYVTNSMMLTLSNAISDAATICDIATSVEQVENAKTALQTAYDALDAAIEAAEAAAVDKTELNAAIAELQALLETVATGAKTAADTEFTLSATSGDNYYISSNAGHNTADGNAEGNTDGAGIAGLLDDDASTYFHSRWGGTAVDEDHYLQVDLGEGNEISDFVFEYAARHIGWAPNNSPAPTAITVSVSNSADFATSETLASLTADADSLPLYTDDGATLWKSDVMYASQAYRYLRFTVTASTGPGGTTFNGHYFFGMGTFNLYPTVAVEGAYSLLGQYSSSLYVTQTLVDETAAELTSATTVSNNSLATYDDVESATAAVEAQIAALEAAIAKADCPVLLTTDATAPVLYNIYINRSSTSALYWDSSDTKVGVTTVNASAPAQAWYFMEGADGTFNIYPYKAEGNMLATNSFAEGTGKVVSMAAATDGYSYDWNITAISSSTWYNISILNGEGTTYYFSNYGGVENKMGFYNSNNTTDGGSMFRFVQIEEDNLQSDDYVTLTEYMTGLAEIDMYGDAGLYTEATATAFNSAYATANALVTAGYVAGTDYATPYTALANAKTALAIEPTDELVDGGVYRLLNVITNTTMGNEFHYIVNNGGTAAFTTSVSDNSGYWVYQVAEDGTAEFVSAAGDYTLAWKALDEDGVSYTVAAGTSDSYYSLYSADDIRYLAVTNEVWGTLGFNQGSSKVQSDNWSTDFAVQEVTSDEWAGFTAKVNEGTTGNFGTLNLPFAVTMPEGVVANSVSLNDAGTELVVSEVVAAGSVLPANTPVLLTSDNAGIYTFVPAASSGVSAVETGMEGTLAAKTVSATNAYIMAYTDGAGSEIKFFKLVSGSTVNANKAYYLLPEGLSQMPSLRLNNSFTGIEGIGSADGVVEGVYDLTGRKLDEITAPGVYIVNGKKILVK